MDNEKVQPSIKLDKEGINLLRENKTKNQKLILEPDLIYVSAFHKLKGNNGSTKIVPVDPRRYISAIENRYANGIKKLRIRGAGKAISTVIEVTVLAKATFILDKTQGNEGISLDAFEEEFIDNHKKYKTTIMQATIYMA